ncbi:hypothetical protein [Phycicoccus sonneratiae]|uniref:Uncharacterized protein n=1 Tax=Phycicoccus sonneratiae TaxID=2807628 RepID=A0ABS2CLW5_9MICO|nr:hypothetical protein [Phycicoccus sonneraticus]MBM6400880.1 hypothetical protein [Phycicoccus sonneraticus]
MAASETPPSFVFTEPSRAVRLTALAASAITTLFLRPVTRLAWSAAAIVVVTLAVTVPLRAERRWWVQVLVVVVSVVALGALRALIANVARRPRSRRLLDGPPAFEHLDVMPRRLLVFLLRCADGLRLEFDPVGRELLGVQAAAAEKVMSETLRRQYEQRHGRDDWPRAWAEISSTSLGRATLLDAVRSGLAGLITLNMRFVGDLLAAMLSIFVAAVAWAGASAARTGDPLVPLQVTLVAGLVVSGLAFLLWTVGLRQVVLLDPDDVAGLELPSEIPMMTDEARRAREDAHRMLRETEEYEAIRSNTGRTFLPKVDIGASYVRAVRDHTLRQCLAATAEAAMTLAVLLAAQFAIGRVVSSWPADDHAAWTQRFVVGVALLPVALCLATAFGFWIFTQFDRVVAVVVGATLTAVVPAVLAYALGQGSPLSVGGTAMLSAAVGSLPLAVAELVKWQPTTRTPREASTA